VLILTLRFSKINNNEKVVRFAQVIGVEPNSVKVKDYKSRWGSCSSIGDISFH
jgi:hypothetical protein